MERRKIALWAVYAVVGTIGVYFLASAAGWGALGTAGIFLAILIIFFIISIFKGSSANEQPNALDG
ncbi:hypothetical protein BG28_10920 [Nesterenkonia sp. AN1]|uniref:hypothetical protein n=1 Tax=Nesterenkonia sp. AN1 TaxID=652017 RepID=UPI000450A91C|nr:hypothetical protein [Nesterenkonia sp. AN1]EXF23867.1 hypothetical protein BG28_10920 [Nesterenkonia sp. AN1]